MFEKILSRLAKSLDAHKFPYMIIGGQAVLLYGEPRLTRDIDITLGAGSDRLGGLLVVVKELNFKLLPEDPQMFVRETMVLPALDETTGIRIDFIFSFTAYETQAIKRARRVTILDQKINFAAPEDLIIHKIFAHRPRDLEDVKSILLKLPEIDTSYIRSWLEVFDESSDEYEFVIIFEQLIDSFFENK